MHRVASVTAGDEGRGHVRAPGRERRVPDTRRTAFPTATFRSLPTGNPSRTTRKRTGDDRSGARRRPQTSPIG
ncbi:hypothetical protein [Amycolatopsis plumensis]|uniref:hypothetical protein n=1 Tax=Amycolatopsis plumensis TaxID=236508 RepID=UPI0036139A28